MKYGHLSVSTITVVVISAIVASHPGPFPGDVELSGLLQSVFEAKSGDAWLGVVGSILNSLPWLAGGAVAIALLVKQWRAAILIAAAAAWSWFVMEPGFKYLVKRPRPTADLVQILDVRPGFGFPSGGALHSAMLFGVIFYVFRKTNFFNRKALGGVVGLGGVFCIAIGIGRIVSGAHWASDVLSAWLMAVWIVTAACCVDQKFLSK